MENVQRHRQPFIRPYLHQIVDVAQRVEEAIWAGDVLAAKQRCKWLVKWGPPRLQDEARAILRRLGACRRGEHHFLLPDARALVWQAKEHITKTAPAKKED